VSALLDRRAAAARLGVSLRSFDRHVAPSLPRIAIGTLVRFDPRDIDEWQAARKVGLCTATRAPASTPFGSDAPGDATTDRRAAKILARLRSKQRESTPRLYPVDGGRKRSGARST
jgi:predicted DNA-binding transcriptional regulator AlpA